MSVQFTTTILKFDSMGEKTGWTYITIPATIAQQLFPENKKAFYVNGKIDQFEFKHNSLLPMGGGDFILALNANFRKNIRKQNGDQVHVTLVKDQQGYQVNETFLACLADEPDALKFFNTLTGSHQRYFSRWIEAPKTDDTKEKRMVQAITALAKKMGYAEMIREQTSKRKFIL
jgi:hypothetical protein